MFFFKKDKPQKLDVRQGYDQWAENYACESNPIKSASDETIKKLLPDLKGKLIVDAGCGSGYFCKYAEQAGASEIIGIDFSANMIEQAKRICAYTKFIVSDIQNVELKESSADVIISALVLGHLEKIEPVLLKISKALKNDGVFVISDFHPFLSLKGQKRTFKLENKNYEVPHHIHMLHEYINLLTQCGLTVIKMEEPVWNGNAVIFALMAKKNQDT
jgi:malonyl-CoA O-methyltransferase